ncbi:putative PEP-binding protein, partial [Candidatus Margulisiibacteriota bacterium]
MAGGIGGTGGVGKANVGSNFAFKKISLSYPGIKMHNLLISQTGIQRSFRLNENRLHEAVQKAGAVREGDPILYKDGDDTLCFNVVSMGTQEIKLQLNHIEHKARYMLHLRYAATCKPLNDRLEKSGLGIGIKMKEDKKWRKLDLGKDLPLSIMELGIAKDDVYRIKVTGSASAEVRQKMLLDLWLTILSEEQLDLEKEAIKQRKEKEDEVVQQTGIYEPNFLNINDVNNPEGFSGTSLSCRLSHLDQGKMGSYHGRLVVWRFYKNFDRVRHLLQMDVKVSRINELFEYLIASYKRREEIELDDMKKLDMQKFIIIFTAIKGKFKGLVGKNNEVAVDALEKLLFEQRDRAKESRDRENVETIINYLVKGILGEDMENRLSHTKEPVILAAPSMTMIEAMELQDNVYCVLTSDMEQDSHPHTILTADKGVAVFFVKDKIAALIRNEDDEPVEENMAASVVVGNKTLWLNSNLPENMHQDNIRAQGYAETEEVRALAFNRLERRIIGGNVVAIRATIRSDIDGAKHKFKLYAPDGIGLYTMENAYIRAGKVLNEDELRNIVGQMCDISRLVKIRLVDISPKNDPNRRDEKDIPGIVNENGLGGAEFLVSEEGREKILRPAFRAILKEHISRKGQNDIQIIIPYVVRVDQLEKIRDFLQECKEDILGELKKDGMAARELDLTKESMRIQLGTMVETKEILTEDSDGKEGVYTPERLARHSDFGSVGLNDLRKAFGHDTILYPDIIKALQETNEQYKRFSKSLATCGKINSDKEFFLLAILGIEDFSVDFSQVRRFSEAVRLLKQEELDGMRKSILKAESSEEIEQILDEGQKHIIERLKEQAIHAATTGDHLRKEAEEARLGRIRATKIKTLATVFQILRDNKPDKEERVLGVLADEFGKDSLLEMPQAKDISKWMTNEILVISFLDEWVIRKAINLKCRCTPYIFYRSENGDQWARTIPRGGDTGSRSRYYVEDVGTAKVEGENVRMARVNYFNAQKKVTDQALCVLKPVKSKGSDNVFEINVVVEGQPPETFQVVERRENGQSYLYRKLVAEKLFAANILNEELPLPSHPSISKSKHENVSALFIRDRIGLGDIKGVRIPDLKSSIDRDRQNMYYQPENPEEVNPYNVNQLLFIKMRNHNGSQSYVIAVDNWLENKVKFDRLFEDSEHFEQITQFLGIESEEDAVILSHIADNEALRKENE